MLITKKALESTKMTSSRKKEAVATTETETKQRTKRKTKKNKEKNTALA